MNGQADIKHLHVLLVGGRPASVQVLRTAFGLLGLKQVVAVAESARAIEVLRSQAFSAIFCDAAAEQYKGVTFPIAARQAPGVIDPMTPLFVIYSHARQRQVEQARDVGVTDVLTHPVSAATIARKLEVAILAPRPFIAAPTFFGPDRRSSRDAVWTGEERRTRVARKTKVAKPEVPSGDIAFI
ncbi:MAG TPA: response regulator [Rhizomicrobium sp.]|jgi:two-component system chemotaxis response regulator CheY|nr:response regulator [Rhizomicrobium sp.]